MEGIFTKFKKEWKWVQRSKAGSEEAQGALRHVLEQKKSRGHRGAWDSGGGPKKSVWIASSVTVRGRCQGQRTADTSQGHWIYSSFSKEAWLEIKKKIIFFNASFP